MTQKKTKYVCWNDKFHKTGDNFIWDLEVRPPQDKVICPACKTYHKVTMVLDDNAR
jgi:hypothetical protein